MGLLIGSLVFTALAAALWAGAFKRMANPVDRLLATHGAAFASVLLLASLGNLDGRPMGSLLQSAVEVGTPYLAAQMLWLAVGVVRQRWARRA